MSESETPDFDKFEVADGDGWEKLSADETYADPYVQIEVATYHSPSKPGVPIKWTIAHRKSAIAVASRDENGDWLMIHQERFPVQKTLWEFPAGQIDDLDRKLETDTIVGTVHQELREEAGYELAPNSDLVPLGYFFSSQGFTTEHVYLFYAPQVVPSMSARTEVGGERIPDIGHFSDKKLKGMIANGEIRDALSLALFARLSARDIFV